MLQPLTEREFLIAIDSKTDNIIKELSEIRGQMRGKASIESVSSVSGTLAELKEAHKRMDRKVNMFVGAMAVIVPIVSFIANHLWKGLQ